MSSDYDFLATYFGIQDLHYQAGNEYAWNSTLDTQACVIDAGYNLSVTARVRGSLTNELFDELYTDLLQRLEAEFREIPHHKDSHWAESMRSWAILHVLKTHKDLIRQVTEGVSLALEALYESVGREEHPDLDPEAYFRQRVTPRVIRRI